MPNSLKTSALPDLELIALLPCLATATPVAAVTNATPVEILNDPVPLPPVPPCRPAVASRLESDSALAHGLCCAGYLSFSHPSP